MAEDKNKDKLDDLDFQDDNELVDNEPEEKEEEKKTEKKGFKGLSSGVVRILLYAIGVIILLAITVTVAYLVATKTADKPDKISV
ncbi:MAG TPA: hypothetical protein PK449_03020, partial [Exilispira sp.]|nr:hypothetical protein [Exilispira sp.]